MKKCFECDLETHITHEHHVIPRSLGGTKTVVLCEKCHSLIHGVNLKISNLVKLSVIRKKKNNQRVSRFAPIGYKFNNGYLVKDEQEQTIVNKVISLYKSGYSFNKIASILNKNGFSSRGSRWYANTISSIVSQNYICPDSSTG